MRISIVIPVYNDPRIGKAIASVVEQRRSMPDVELIVVDGGSKPETLEAIGRFRGDIDVLVSERDEGIFDALNKGVSRATGEVIGLIGADDRYEDADVLRDVAAAMASRDIDACYGDLVYVNDADQVVRYWRAGAFARWKLYLGWMPPHFSLFVRRRVYDEVGPFDLRFRVAADYDHMLRMLYRHRANARYLPRVLTRMTLGGNSNRSLRNIATGNIESLRAWGRSKLLLGLLVPVLKPASKLLQYTRRPRHERHRA